MYYLYIDYDAGLDSFGSVNMLYMPDPVGFHLWCNRSGWERETFTTYRRFLSERYILDMYRGTAYDACQLCKRLERFARHGCHAHIVKFAEVFEQDTKRYAVRAVRAARARAAMESAPDER